MDNQNLNDQELVRREKLKKYESFKVDPFGKAFKVSHLASEVHSLFDKKSPNSLEKNKPYVTVAGRIKNLRRMGKASFMNIQDKSGNIQVYKFIWVLMLSVRKHTNYLSLLISVTSLVSLDA